MAAVDVGPLHELEVSSSADLRQPVAGLEVISGSPVNELETSVCTQTRAGEYLSFLTPA